MSLNPKPTIQIYLTNPNLETRHPTMWKGSSVFEFIQAFIQSPLPPKPLELSDSKLEVLPDTVFHSYSLLCHVIMCVPESASGPRVNQRTRRQRNEPISAPPSSCSLARPLSWYSASDSDSDSDSDSMFGSDSVFRICIGIRFGFGSTVGYQDRVWNHTLTPILQHQT